MERITSRTNENIKLYRRLTASRAERETSGLFTAEGARLCAEAASAGIRVEIAFFTENALEKGGMEPLASAASCVCVIPPELAEYISDTSSPQGVLCVCRIPERPVWEPDPKGSYILLDGLRDPGNTGTVIRTAEAAGITAVVMSEDCADLWSPKVLRSSMGSAFRQAVVRTASLAGFAGELEKNKISCYAAALDKDALDIRLLPGAGGKAVVIGNEGAGVSREVMDSCSGSVYIPMAGRVESLNAAVAAAIAMWELSGRRL